MKKLAVLFLFLSGFMFAQEETLLGFRHIEHGGFGGPVVKFTQVNGEFATMIGGRGGWIINHSFIIGGGGYGLVNRIDGNKFFIDEDNPDDPAKKRRIIFGYGGLELEYIMRPHKLIHTSVYLLIGGGAVTQRDPKFDYDDDFTDNEDNDPFFVILPEANITLNVTRFFRISGHVGYRITNGIDEHNLKDEDFSGVTGGLTFRFGKF